MLRRVLLIVLLLLGIGASSLLSIGRVPPPGHEWPHDGYSFACIPPGCSDDP